jgi:hypothetical protein
MLSTALKSALASMGLEIRRFRPGGSDGSRHSNFGEQEILRRLVESVPTMPRYCVDIGAGDGALHSNSLALFEKGWSGAALEWDGSRFGKLAWRHRDRNLNLVRGKVTPENVVPLFKGLGVPREFGILSLDIDGYDYFVMEALLGEFVPQVLCMEINEKIPPPLRFTVLWSDGYAWKGDHFYGQSLSQAQALASSRGYALVALEYNNAFFIRRGSCSWPELTPEQAYQAGYRDRPDRLDRLPWNKDMENLQNRPPQDAARLLREKFAAYEGRYRLELPPS